MKYTVLLLYPEYSDRSTETYLAHVEASGPAAAQLMAQQAAEDEYHWYEFKVLFVTEGHYNDLSKEY